MTRPRRVSRFLAFGAAGLLVAGAAAAALGVAADPSANASTSGAAGVVPLPSVGPLVHQVLVDGSADNGAGYIFYSEGLPAADLGGNHLATTGVVVTTLSGSYVKTLLGDSGTEGIALSPDGSTLYVAIAGAIAAINTDTLALAGEVDLYANKGVLLPYDLAVQGGELWISYLAYTQQRDFIGDYVGGVSLADIDSSILLTPTQLSGPAWSVPPSLAADPEDGGALVAVAEGQSPPQVATYDVESATPGTPVATSAAAAAQFANCGAGAPATVLPGGASFLMSCDGTETSYSVADLERQGTYGSGLPFSASDGVDSAAIAANGTIALGTSVTATGVLAQAGTYDSSGTGMLNDYNFNPVNTGNWAAPNMENSVDGLGWVGSTLYVLLEGLSPADTPSYALDVLPDADRAASALTLGGTSKAAYGTPVSISGRLTFSAYSGPAATVVTVTRTHVGGSTGPIGNVTGTANGAFSFKDTASLVPGTWIYTVSYAGTSMLAPSKATRTVVISKAAAGATLTASATDVKAGTTVHLTVKLPKTAGPVRLIDIYAEPAGQSKKLIKSAKVGPGGTVEIAYKVARNTVFSANIAGDSDFNSGTVATTVRA